MAGRPGTGTVLAGVGVLALVAVLVLPGGTTDDPGGDDVSSGSHRINLVAYSVPKPGFSAVIPGFRETDDGKDTGFAESYGASGDQSRKVARHVPADIVNFSLEPDVTRLVKDGLVADDWKDGVPGDESGRSVPFGSVVSFVTRKGNPENLRNWDDLLRPGIEIITPNPASSGSAKWNLLAPYAAWYFQALNANGGDAPAAHTAALDKVDHLVNEHIHVRPKSGREATSAFEQGQGDVLLSYENEAVLLGRDGDDISYLNPTDTFRIENPVAVVTGDDLGDDTKATEFRDYLFTPDAEKRWASEGFRPGPDLFDKDGKTPVIDSLPADQRDAFRPTQNVWTIDDLAEQFRTVAPDVAAKKDGWALVDAVLFAKATPGSGEKDGAITRIYGGGE
jgi:ABC-type sulfate transport system substrate-binding protein